MTKAELIKALEQFPDSMEVFVDDRLTDFKYGLVNSVQGKRIMFSEDEDGGGLRSEDDVIILSEE